MQLGNITPAESAKGIGACQSNTLAMRLYSPLYKCNVCFIPGLDEMAADSAKEEDTLEPVIRKDSLKVSTN